jgi:transposase
MTSSNGLPQLPAILVAEDRSEGERSEAERRSVAAKIGGGPKPTPRPNPEVVAKPKRRTPTAEYKQRILTEADNVTEPGGIGALLRREGIYSSQLTSWRQQRQSAIQNAHGPHKRGPKPKNDPLVQQNQKLVRENLRLTEKLRTAELIIDVQKKVAALLGRPIFSPEPEDKR